MNIFASSTNTNCGECTGTSIASISGGIPPYTYLWNDSPVNPQTTQTAIGLCEGIYSVTVTDDNGCSAETSISIEEHIANVQISSINPICENVCNGSVNIENIEATPPYNIEWSNEETTYTINNLCSGTYSVTIIDANNCSVISSVSINGEYEIIPTISTNDISCFGNCDGNASVLTTGGILPYTYSWDDQNSQTNETAIGLCSDNYNVVVTDDNNCSVTVSVDITEPTLLSASITNLTNQICTTPGSATVEGSGGTLPYTYFWPSEAGGVIDNIANELEAGITYTVTVIDANNCETQIDVNIINEGTGLNVNSYIHQNPICNGDENGEIKVNVVNGIPDYTIDWGETPVISSDNTTVINSFSAGTYNFTVTDANGCIGESTTTLIDNPPVTATISSYLDVTCYGTQDGTATVIADGGVDPYTYLWDDPQSQTTPIASGLSGGTYNVTVTDENECEAYTSVPIWEGTNIKPGIEEVIDVTCFGDCDGSITLGVSGGVPSYTYEWDDPLGQVEEQAINLCPGHYTVTITDSHGCTATTDATITQNPLLTATISSSTISCYGSNNGEATVTATGGDGNYTYLWSSDAQATETAYNLAPGTHSVTVYDGNLCEAYAEVTIGQNPEMTAAITETSFIDLDCFGDANGTAVVEVLGGVGTHSYLWSASAENQTTQEAINLVAGLHEVTVTDENYCTAIASVTITQPDELAASATYTEIECNGDLSDITVSATGGAGSYTGTGVYEVSAGTYTYTVTDENSCTDEISITISEPSTLTASAGQDITVCGGYKGRLGDAISGTAQGGTPTYTYVWTPVEFLASTDIAEPFVDIDYPGIYTYTVIVTDANGCTVTDDVTITIHESPHLVLSATPETICYEVEEDITLTAVANGGTPQYVYSWGPPIPESENSNTVTITNDATESTTYSVTITDQNDCLVSCSTIVNVENIEITSYVIYDYGSDYGNVSFGFEPSDISFDDFTEIIITNNVTGDSYNVTGQNQPFELPAGENSNYTATFTSINGCTYTSDFSIIYAESFICSTMATPITCEYNYNGAIDVDIQGGIAPFTVRVYFNGELSIYTFNTPGEHTIDLSGIPPTETAIDIIIEDDNGIVSNHSVNGLNFAWAGADGITLTNSNLGSQSEFSNQVIQLGDEYDQTLNILHDLTFTNCEIYTATHPYNSISETQWSIVNARDLTINNTTIQSGCPDQMWQGINAAGYQTTQNMEIQTAVIIDNSEIDDAIYAVKSNDGAIIKATNSRFYNNKYGLYFGPFKNKHTLSKIEYNHFETDSDLKNPLKYPRAHVYMDRVYGLTFKGNDFYNSKGWFVKDDEVEYVEMRGSGIYSRYSSFTVTPINGITTTLMSPAHKNTFHGLFYGIRIYGQMNYAPKIQYCDFENNLRGIKLAGTNSARILYNEFYTTMNQPVFQAHFMPYTNHTQAYDASYAAYIDRSTNTWFEENDVYDGKAGVYIYNTGENGTRFYRNYFGLENKNGVITPRGMNAATVVVGKNSNWDVNNQPIINTGLQVLCNDYTDNDFAISVFNGNMRKKQGENYNGVTTDKLAGNQFNNTNINGVEFNVNIEDEPGSFYNYSQFDIGTEYKYNQHDDIEPIEGSYRRELQSYTLLKVDPETIDGVYFDETLSCPSHFGLHHINIGTAISSLADKKSTIDNLKNQYTQTVDRGDTEYMLTIAETLSPRNFRQYTPILNNDGYLSDTVFMTLLDNRTAQKPVIASVLIENSPLPVDILEEVNNSDYLDNGHKIQINKYQAGNNNRIMLENQISDLSQEVNNIEGEIVNIALNNDSIPEAKQQVISYFESKPDIEPKDLITTYNLNVASENFVEAQNYLNELRIYANNLPGTEADEINTYCDVNELYIAYTSDSTSNNILMDNKDFLFEATQSISPLYSVMAEILYSYTSDSAFFEYTPLPYENITPRNINVLPGTEEESMFTFEVYPNPADQVIYVEYDLSEVYDDATLLYLETLGLKEKDACQYGKITIYSNDGKVLDIVPLEYESGKQKLNINHYVPGQYLIEITDCYGNSRTKKITKK